jgi:hypothetical protein
MPCNNYYHDCLATNCEICEEVMVWVDCPTGGWWRHIDHPEDSHDGEAPVPEHPEGLMNA